MKKKGNARSHLAVRQLITFTLALVTVLGCMGTAFAEETPTPAEPPAAAQETYVLDGLTYYNVHSQNFQIKEKFLRDLMSNKSSELGNRSMAQLWLELGTGMAIGWENLKEESGLTNLSPAFNYDKAKAAAAMLQGITNDSRSAQSDSFKAGSSQVIYATSMDSAATQLLFALPTDLYNMGDVKNIFRPYPSDQADAAKQKKDVVAAVCWGYQNNCLAIAEVYFTDFKVVALLPDNSGKNYVTTMLRDSKKPERTYASNVKNMTLSTVQASQNVSTGWQSSVSSQVNSSSAYAYSEAIKIGAKHNFAIAEVSAEFSFSATQTFTNGWSKTTTDTKTGNLSETVSVSLPPYTNVLLEQGSTSTEAETRYNCPIGLRYNVLIKYITETSGNAGLVKSAEFSGQFGQNSGGDARADLYRRAIQLGDMTVDDEINWKSVNAVAGVNDAIKTITSHVPMSDTGAIFRETRDTTYTEVKSIVPLEPLAVVKIVPPSPTDQNYLHKTLKMGESSYTNYLTLRGENRYGAEYYGFSPRNGHWIVTKPDGTEWKDDTAPVKVDVDSATGFTRYTGIKPGTCYLKYIIDENVYSTVNSATTFTKNSDLLNTATLEVTVSGVKEELNPTGTITITGNYFGLVGSDPDALDGPDGLNVSIRDMSGKELDVKYYWEKQELDSRGIQFNAENKVTFTQTGKYHVRVVCDEIAAKSNWYEIDVHNYTFTPEGANIMATCTDPQCPDMMYTLHRPEKTVYGDGKSAWATVTGKIAGLTPPNVEYRRGTEKLSTPPRDAGTYTASITIGGATAEVEYTIAKAETLVTELPIASEQVEGGTLYYSKLTGGAANTPGSFAWSDSSIRVTLEDSNKTPYQVTFTPTNPNYLSAYVYVTVPVVPSRPWVTVKPIGKRLVYNGQAQELVVPGEADKGNLLYGVSQDENVDIETLEYSEKIPTAAEAGIYYIWYAVRDPNDIHINPINAETVIEKTVPTVSFPNLILPYTGEEQPLALDPVVGPGENLTLHYSLDDPDNELLEPPTGKDPGAYTLYYRVESSNPSCESLPYGEPVQIMILENMEEVLADLDMSIEGWTYGEEPKAPVVSGNPYNIPISFEYKERDALDESYSAQVPTDAGDYTVKATAEASNFYGERSVTADFTIEKRVPVLGEDFDIVPLEPIYDGTYKELVAIEVKEGSGLKLWCSFDRKNTLAGTPKKRDIGDYTIWYKVSGNRNYEDLSEWAGPIAVSIQSEVTVTVPSAAKFYDGMPVPLSWRLDGLSDEYTVSDVVYSGDSITDVGEIEISVVSLKITDPYGDDVTDECSVRFVPGRLVVLAEPDFIVPAALKSIAPEAFTGIGAESVLLPESVEEVGFDAFRDCEKLTAFIVLGTETELGPDALMGCENVTVYAPAGSKAAEFAEENKIDFIPLLNQAG